MDRLAQLGRGAVLLAAALLLAVAPARAQSKVGTAAAQFLGLDVGARAAAMGGAQAASAQGPSALFWNPALVTSMTHSAVEFAYADWFIDASLQHVGAVLALGEIGHVGVTVTAFNYGEIEVTTIAEPDGTGEQFTPLSLSVGAAYARTLTDRFSIGGTVKIIHESIQKMSATGAAVDLGVTYRTSLRGLRLGMTLTNFGSSMRINGADLRIPVDIDPDNAGNVDELPGFLETGEWPLPLAFRVGAAANVLEGTNQRLTVSVDALAPYDDQQSANIGSEFAYRELFFLRGGYRRAFKSAGEDGGWSLGAGIRYGFGSQMAVTADYAIMWFDANAFDPPHMFSVGFNF